MGYVLTDADIDMLWRRMFRWGDDVEPNRMIGRPAVRKWFAGLPVVSRDEARRALGPMTDEEYDRYMDVYFASNEKGEQSRRTAFSDIMEARLAILDGAPTEPSGNEPTMSPRDMTEFVQAVIDAVDLFGEDKPFVIGKRTLEMLREAVAKAKPTEATRVIPDVTDDDVAQANQRFFDGSGTSFTATMRETLLAHNARLAERMRTAKGGDR